MGIELNKSGVVFDEHEHTYTLHGKELHGITGMINRQLFPDKYDGIPQEVLNKAAEYGSNIHSTIELCDTFGDYGNKDPIYQAYRALMAGEGLERVANEYIVTDGEHFASPIDVLAVDGDGGLAIIDIKTTSKHDGDYVSWQGSVLRHLFCLLNPHLRGKVKSVYTLWLPRPHYGSPKLFKEAMRDESEVVALLDAEKRGETYIRPASALTPIEGRLSLTAEAIDEIARIERTLAELKEKSEELKKGLLLAMAENGVKSFKCDKFMLTRIVPSAEPSCVLDTKRLKEERPDVYEAFKKEKNQSSESIRIKLY